MSTILTGIRANSILTLGNYLGALLPMVRLANAHSDHDNINIFVPDLHSIISPIDGDLNHNVLESIKYYLAAGLRPGPNVHFYRSSRVPAHSELCWILNCVASMGELSRMTQFKDKSSGQDSCNVGIFDYPVLMAADILLYDAEFVPVGEDQFQHLELTRNLALRFNHRYGDVFVPPKPPAEQAKFMGLEGGVRIRDLVNPEKKMSKSAPAENAKILLTDSPELAAKKIKSATTDSLGRINFDFWQQPGISNLLQIKALVSDTPLEDVITAWAGESHYGDLKSQVADAVAALLSTFQAKLTEISDADVLALLENGEEYANHVAGAKLYAVQRAVGLRD